MVMFPDILQESRTSEQRKQFVHKLQFVHGDRGLHVLNLKMPEDGRAGSLRHVC